MAFDEQARQLFLKVRDLPVKHHLSVGLAAIHYARALMHLGVDLDMVFVRLVSAVENISGNETVDDHLEGYAIDGLLRDGLPDEVREEVSRVLSVRKAMLRFVSVLRRGATTFLRGEPTQPSHTQVTNENITDVAGAVYRARSAYLHQGIPMYHSTMGEINPAWHMDPSVGLRVDQRSYKANDKLPKASFFHRLVRHCILEYIETSKP